jgi:tetrahydromethanopterin S-methyltransferase subunit C
MSATSQGAISGAVLGIVFVLLGQQLGYYDLSDLATSIEYLVIAIVVGAAIFGAIGMALGRLYLRRHPPKDASPPANP